MRRLALCLFLIPATAAADDGLPDPMVIEQCLATGLVEGCIGLMTRLCEAEQGHMHRGPCLGAETAVWQARADAALALLAQRADAVAALATARGVPVPDLAGIEQAFATYREAACAWAESAWDGVHSGWAWAECQRDLTARHALWLAGQAAP